MFFGNLYALRKIRNVALGVLNIAQVVQRLALDEWHIVGMRVLHQAVPKAHAPPFPGNVRYFWHTNRLNDSSFYISGAAH